MSRIVVAPAAVLEQTATAVEDPKAPGALQLAGELLTILAETPYAAAIAAPQVGASVAMFAYKDPKTGEGIVISNPTIVDHSLRMRPGWEGCLSFPGWQFYVPRHLSVVMRGRDILGEKVRMPAHGFLARVWQHEIDHLHGILAPNHSINRRRAP